MFKPNQLKSILIQTFVITGISFILTEITFRIYHKINPTFLFADQSYNQWRGKPYAQEVDFQLNSKGFKDVEFTTEKLAEKTRILGIGDSFNFGIVPYRYNYLTILEEKLNQGKQKVEIINMGIPGLGPKDYLSILVHEGLELKPDMVLLSFYIGNDFMDNQFKAKERQWDKSYVISFIRSLIKIQTEYQGLPFNPNATEYIDEQPTRTNESYLQDTRNKSNMFVRDPADDIFKGYFKDALADLLKIKQICDYQKIKLVVVIIPDEVQVDQNLQATIVEMFDSDDPNNLDFRLPNRMLQEAFEQHNIEYIDLMDDLVVTATQTRLYKPNDTHWNIAGNQRAAEVLADYLTKLTF